MKTNIVKQLTNLSDKAVEAESSFYIRAENYLRSIILKQKEEKINLRSANIILFEKYRTPDSVDYSIEDLERLYYDGDVSIAAGGYDYLLTDFDMSSVIRLVNWVKDNV